MSEKDKLEKKEQPLNPDQKMSDEAFKDLCYLVKKYCKIKSMTVTVNAKGEITNSVIEY